MKLCTTCFYPNTKPDLEFDQKGICSACVSFENRKKTNWEEREKEFIKIVTDLKKKRTGDYDCIIPVSGGKDSTWQLIKALEYGLKPLCVNSRTCDLSTLGRKNLDNIRALGADLIEVAPNSIVRKQLNKIGLLEVGDVSWPEHVAIFTIPFNIAVKFKVNIILWGENSQNEYGGPIAATKKTNLDRSWLEEFGGLLGLRVNDIFNHYNIKKQDLAPYLYPTSTEIKKLNLRSMFLGYFFPWDGHQNAMMVKKNGFLFYKKLVEGTGVSYENLDNYQTGIHDYFKYLKYGFGRTTDIMNNLLKRNYVSKKIAKENIKKYDGNFPHTYLGKEISDILKDIDVSMDEFEKCCDQFTNKKLFKCDNEGNLIKKNLEVIKSF
tara:strand:- start:431 stop:1564 length:1134 start_codon:yes stop_codon:yes gene_type:complete